MLEDPLAQVASEEQAVGSINAVCFPMRCQKPQLRDADILSLIDHDILEWGMLAACQVGGQLAE